MKHICAFALVVIASGLVAGCSSSSAPDTAVPPTSAVNSSQSIVTPPGMGNKPQNLKPQQMVAMHVPPSGQK